MCVCLYSVCATVSLYTAVMITLSTKDESAHKSSFLGSFMIG